MKVTISKKVLFQLMRSHDELVQEKYEKNQNYDSTHFSHIATKAIIKELHFEVMQEFVNFVKNKK